MFRPQLVRPSSAGVLAKRATEQKPISPLRAAYKVRAGTSGIFRKLTTVWYPRSKIIVIAISSIEILRNQIKEKENDREQQEMCCMLLTLSAIYGMKLLRRKFYCKLNDNRNTKEEMYNRNAHIRCSEAKRTAISFHWQAKRKNAHRGRIHLRCTVDVGLTMHVTLLKCNLIFYFTHSN